MNMEFLSSLSLDNLYVQHTLFAFATLVLGLLGLVLGQRMATNGKLSIIAGLAVGIGTMLLFATPFGYLAPGWCGVFIVCFLASSQLIKLVCGSAGHNAAAPEQSEGK